MKIHSSKRASRLWIEAAIVGVCIALTAAMLQYTVGNENWMMRLLLLIGAALGLCLVQFLVSKWVRPRASADRAVDAPPQESSDHLI